MLREGYLVCLSETCSGWSRLPKHLPIDSSPEGSIRKSPVTDLLSLQRVAPPGRAQRRLKETQAVGRTRGLFCVWHDCTNDRSPRKQQPLAGPHVTAASKTCIVCGYEHIYAPGLCFAGTAGTYGAGRLIGTTGDLGKRPK
jgi:hypothetical protein